MLVNPPSIDPRMRADGDTAKGAAASAQQQIANSADRASDQTATAFADTSSPRASDKPKSPSHAPASRERSSASRQTGVPPRTGTLHRKQPESRARAPASRADDDRLIANLNRMLTTAQIGAWNESSDYIRGSIEHDLSSDRGVLETSAQNVRTAQSGLDDAQHQMTSRADPFSGIPWPADYTKYEAARQSLARAQQANEDAEKSWREANRKHLADMPPYVSGAMMLDATNRIAQDAHAGRANWIVSATDARALCRQATQNAKQKIDDHLGKAWEQLVLDLRAWRSNNVGKIDSESIVRQMNKTSETYLLLEQDAAQKKGIIDARVKSFDDWLDQNRSAVIARRNPDDAAQKSAVVDLLRERRANLDSAISDSNDQSHLAASLMAATVNHSRLATPETSEAVFVSEAHPGGSPHDYAGKLSFYDTRSGKDILIGTKDLGVTSIALPEGDRGDPAAAVQPDSIVPPPLTPPGTHLKLQYSYERSGAVRYPEQNGLVFTTQQTNAQKQAEKDFTKYGGSVAGLVRAGEYGYVRFNNSQFVKDKLPTLSRVQKPMMPFNAPLPATLQFATRGISIASGLTRGAMYLESAANKVARGEDPTSDYVAAGAAFAQGTIDSSVGLYVDAALVSASQYKADNREAKLPGKRAQTLFPQSRDETARGISYEYKPDGTIESAQRIDPKTGELQTYTPAHTELAKLEPAGNASPSNAGTTSGAAQGEAMVRTVPPVADSEIQSGIRRSADSIVASAERVAQAYGPLNTSGLPQIDTGRARLNALAAELRESADQAKNSFQKFAFNVELNRANELGGKKWPIPGGVKLMAYASAGLVVPALVEYGVKVSDYIERAKQGTLTRADDLSLAASTTNAVTMVTPYIPVVGPIITPFLLIASMAMNAAAGSFNKTPVEKVSALLQSQTAHPLANLGGYNPIVPPAPQA
jgi:hypothetical protein